MSEANNNKSFDPVTYAAAVRKANEYTDSVINKGVPCGYVTNGDVFPTTRPDGSALQDEDFVRPLASSTFPFTIGSVTFDNRFSKAIYSNATGMWIGYPGVIQDTSETPLKNPTSEQIHTTDSTQAQYNVSAKAELAKRVVQSTDSSSSLVYTRESGVDGTTTMSIAATASAVVRRDASGNTSVADPTDPTHAATKNYVDLNAAPDNITIERQSNLLQVKDSGIVAAKLSTDAVETQKIKDGNVTLPKIDPANISTAIPATGATNDKLATEKAVADFAETADISAFNYDNTNEQFEITYKKPSGSTATKTVLASSIANGVVTQTAAQALSNKTIDVDNNTVSNIEVDNLKTGVLDTTDFSISDDTHIPSSKLVDAKIKNAVAAIIKFVGYVAPTAPAGAGIKIGSYWYQSSATDMPTTFPISVYTYDGAAWSSTTTSYTPSEWEAWINKNTNKEYYYSGGAWNQIDFTVAADNLTINKNISGELQVKDGGITTVKFATQTAADAGKGYLIKSDGTTEINYIRQYKRVSTLTGEIGNTHTVYILEQPDASHASGIYAWDSLNGFVNYSSTSGSSGPQFIGLVKAGDTFPVLRPDGTGLILGDYVKADPGETFPFTIGSCTFTSIKDQATFLGNATWQLNSSPYQSTIEVSVHDATTESLSGTTLFQNNINTENVVALKDRPTKDNVSLRKNSTAYVVGDRVFYPGKNSYVLVCKTAGTTTASEPSWPTGTIVSGTTTIADGTALWTIYDMTESGESNNVKRNTNYAVGARATWPTKTGYLVICKTAGTTAASEPTWPATIESGVTEITDGTATWVVHDLSYGDVSKEDISLLTRGEPYYEGDRCVFSGKAGYLLICTQAGKAGSVAPTWPTTVVSGVTELVDGGTKFLIVDMTEGLPQLSTFPTCTEASTQCFQFIGTDSTHKKDGFYHKVSAGSVNKVTSASFIVYARSLPPVGEFYVVFTDPTCQNVKANVALFTTDGTQYVLRDYSLSTDENAAISTVNLFEYELLFKDMTLSEAEAGTVTEGRLISPSVLSQVVPNVGMRKNSTAYSTGARVLYPDKAGYVLICTTAGYTASSAPAWPGTIESGVTTLADGGAVWKIYDASVAGVPQLDVFPDASSTSPISFQYIGDDSSYEKFEFYKKITAPYSLASTYGTFYIGVLPEVGHYLHVYEDTALTVESANYCATSDGVRILIEDMVGGGSPANANVGGGPSYSRVYEVKTITTVRARGIATNEFLPTENAVRYAITGTEKGLGLRIGEALYFTGARVMYPEKAGYVLVANNSGNTQASLPTWPSTIVSGTTTITDGTITWTIYDETLVSSGVTVDEVGLRKNSTAYNVSVHRQYPGCGGIFLVCKTAGTTASTVPALPSPIASGRSELTDGSVVWTIYSAETAVNMEADEAIVERTRAEVWAKRGPRSTVRFIPSVKFVEAERPSNSVYYVEMWNSTSDGWGTMVIRTGTDQWQCYCKGDEDFTDWVKVATVPYCNSTYVAKSASVPTFTAKTGWTLMGSGVKSIGGNFYFVNITVRNDSGSAQGSSDLQAVTVSGNPLDCALAAACYESINAGYGGPECVLQTKIIKFRCLPKSLPAGSYVPISGVIEWYP